MMKLVTAAALAAAISLGGCASMGGGGGSPAQQVTDIISQVQAYAKQACGFLPEASGVAAVISAMYPAGAGAAASAVSVGQAICAGLSPPTAAAAGGTTIKRVNTPKGVISVRGQRV